MSENCEKVDNITCFICEKDLENDSEEHVVLVTRGLETLKAVSIERNDERHKILDGREAIRVHEKCREKYIMKRGGKFRYNYTPTNVNASTFSPVKKKLRTSSDGFVVFKDKCFMCTRTQRSRKGNSGVLRTVTKPTFQQKLEVALKTVFDEDCKIILKRISCINLVNEKAQYHSACYNKLMSQYLGINSNEEKFGVVGRPQLNISDSMEIIYDYMEKCDDKCFTLQELMEVVGNKTLLLLLLFMIHIYISL